MRLPWRRRRHKRRLLLLLQAVRRSATGGRGASACGCQCPGEKGGKRRGVNEVEGRGPRGCRSAAGAGGAAHLGAASPSIGAADADDAAVRGL